MNDHSLTDMPVRLLFLAALPVLFLGLLLLPHPTSAVTPVTDLSLKIVDFGMYSLEATSKEPVTEAITGEKNKVSNLTLVKQATVIPLTRDVNFGFRYILESTEANPGDTVTITLMITPPPLKNPDGQTVTEGISTWERTIGSTEYAGYVLDGTWEMVPGAWVIKLFFEDRLLGEKAFELVNTQ